MDLKDAHDEMSIIEKTKGKTFEKTEMTRDQQTRWILGALFVIAFFALGFYLSEDDPRYPGCTGFMGIQDTSCKAEHASRRLGGL